MSPFILKNVSVLLMRLGVIGDHEIPLGDMVIQCVINNYKVINCYIVRGKRISIVIAAMSVEGVLCLKLVHDTVTGNVF